MTLPDVLLALADVAGTALEGADLPVAAGGPRLYHGPPPDDMACADGRIYVWWEPIDGAERFPTPAVTHVCGAPALVTVKVRWTTCWPVAAEYVTAHSEVAATLAVGAWVMHHAYLTLVCERRTDPDDPLSVLRNLALVQTRPRPPAAGAGVETTLRVVAGLAADATPVGPS